MDNDVDEAYEVDKDEVRLRKALARSLRLEGRRMTLDHQSYHVEFEHDEEGKARAVMGPNPNCPYCNEGWEQE